MMDYVHSGEHIRWLRGWHGPERKMTVLDEQGVASTTQPWNVSRRVGLKEKHLKTGAAGPENEAEEYVTSAG